ncbi:MAG: hypothetical protein J0M16_01260 [Gammaproteobacteria bacterium]|nr:hypothetical protein [Gammaproteobacteria bacterium]
MLDALQNLVVRISRTWWLYFPVVLIFAGSLMALNRIGAEFPAHAAGAMPFDLQNGLATAEVYPQVAGYTDQARSLYLTFTLIDYAFPFFAGLFIAATVAFALRNGFPDTYGAVVRRRLLPLLMLGTLFDWLENVSAAATIWLFPREFGWLPWALVAAKRCKLLFATGGNVLMLLSLLAYAGRRGLALLRR